MVEIQDLYVEISDEYSGKILNWAIKKTGNRSDGEDLSQEVLVQVFIAVSKQRKIDELENFIWKVAHYVWCNHIRSLVRHSADELSEALPDGTDFADDYVENEAIQAALLRMRRKIANLSNLQRETMILHYLDGFSVRDIASKLNITDNSVTWHLFEARKKVKKELDTMKNENTYVFRPGKLNVSASGDIPPIPDTEKINDSLIRQNLCLLCHENGKTIDELTELTGVPKPYLEHDLNWLVGRELLTLNGRRYQTAFLIMNPQYFAYRKELYLKNKEIFIDKVIDYLWSTENKIREIGFYGAEFPAERLMWAVLTMFISYMSRNNELLLRLKNRNNCEIHPDGGKYYIMAVDRSDGHKIDVTGYYNNNGWESFYGICSDNCSAEETESYYWLGVYNFSGKDCRPEIVTGEKETQILLHKLYCNATEKSFCADDLSPDEKEKLAEAVERGLILKDGGSYKPDFIIFTPKQLAKLRSDIYINRFYL